MSIDRITRRSALGVLGISAASRLWADASDAPAIVRATRVDHVALDVGDMDKQMAYYRRLFGNEVLKDSKTQRRYVRLGPCHLAIAPTPAGQAPRINHFAVGVASFNAAAMKRVLDGAGIPVRESDNGLFVTDPDGNSIEICADQSWKLLKNTAPEAFPKQDALFHAIGMHHMAIQAGDMPKMVAFYGKLFGKPIYDPPTSLQPVFLAGDTRVRIYPPAPNKIVRTDHFSALVENFDAPAALQVVKALGAKAELSKDGALNEFYDPEGIRMQVTLPGQTYGTPAK